MLLSQLITPVKPTAPGLSQAGHSDGTGVLTAPQIIRVDVIPVTVAGVWNDSGQGPIDDRAFRSDSGSVMG